MPASSVQCPPSILAASLGSLHRLSSLFSHLLARDDSGACCCSKKEKKQYEYPWKYIKIILSLTWLSSLLDDLQSQLKLLTSSVESSCFFKLSGARLLIFLHACQTLQLFPICFIYASLCSLYIPKIYKNLIVSPRFFLCCDVFTIAIVGTTFAGPFYHWLIWLDHISNMYYCSIWPVWFHHYVSSFSHSSAVAILCCCTCHCFVWKQ